jgi:hypothetical protein
MTSFCYVVSIAFHMSVPALWKCMHTSRKNSFGWERSHWCTAPRTSLSDLKDLPPIAYLSSPKTWKSLGARSGEYGGCGRHSKDRSWIVATVERVVWGPSIVMLEQNTYTPYLYTSDTRGCTDGNAINIVIYRWWSSCSFSLVFEAVFGLPLPVSIHGTKWTIVVTFAIEWFNSCCWCQWDCFKGVIYSERVNVLVGLRCLIEADVITILHVHLYQELGLSYVFLLMESIFSKFMNILLTLRCCYSEMW